VAFRLLREHVTRVHAQIAAANRAPSAEQVALVARLARHALHAAPTREAAFELLTSTVTPLSEQIGDDNLSAHDGNGVEQRRLSAPHADARQVRAVARRARSSS
jgi:hypothetical protein